MAAHYAVMSEQGIRLGVTEDKLIVKANGKTYELNLVSELPSLREQAAMREKISRNSKPPPTPICNFPHYWGCMGIVFTSVCCTIIVSILLKKVLQLRLKKSKIL